MSQKSTSWDCVGDCLHIIIMGLSGVKPLTCIIIGGFPGKIFGDTPAGQLHTSSNGTEVSYR